MPFEVQHSLRCSLRPQDVVVHPVSAARRDAKGHAGHAHSWSTAATTAPPHRTPSFGNSAPEVTSPLFPTQGLGLNGRGSYALQVWSDVWAMASQPLFGSCSAQLLQSSTFLDPVRELFHSDPDPTKAPGSSGSLPLPHPTEAVGLRGEHEEKNKSILAWVTLRQGVIRLFEHLPIPLIDLFFSKH